MPSAQRDLWDPPEPPTGPAVDVRRFTGPQATAAAFAAWCDSRDGRRALAYMLRVARAVLVRGDTRLSVYALVEELRTNRHLEVNNVWRPWIADRLIARDPRLTPLIERRRRKIPPERLSHARQGAQQ